MQKSKPALRIKRALVEDLPAEISADDAKAIGAWLGQRMRAAGFPRGAVTISLGREHVGLKRMTLPTAAEDELPDMTRLAMQRELPFDADTAVIDFIPLERGETNTTVLAVAAPRPVIDFARTLAEAAGLTIERIALRTMGAAALMQMFGDQRSAVRSQKSEASGQGSDEVGTSSVDDPNPKSKIQNPKSHGTLAVDVTGEGVEFCLVANGAVRFSRAAEVPQPQDQLAIAEAVVTETRRTWMSYRIGEDASDVVTAVIMGDRRVSQYAAGPLGDMLKIPVHVLEDHPLIDPAGHDLDCVWPLAGLLLEPALGGEMINFAKPRKAPDVALRRRIRAYAAALAVVLFLGLGWTAARKDLQRLQDRQEGLGKEIAGLLPGTMRYSRDFYKLEHLNKWTSPGVDWLKHASYLCTIAPPPDKVVLDSWTGVLDFRGVMFDNKTGKWSADEQLTIVIDGEARDRETADAFREALTQNSVYNTSTTGADFRGGKRMPFGFTYRLRTKVGAPNEPPAATPTAVSADKLHASETESEVAAK